MKGFPETWNTGLVSSESVLPLAEKLLFLSLVCSSSDGVTIKIPYGVGVLLHRVVTTDEFSVTVTKNWIGVS